MSASFRIPANAMLDFFFSRLTEGGEQRTNQFSSSSVVRHDEKGQVKVCAAFYNIRI